MLPAVIDHFEIVGERLLVRALMTGSKVDRRRVGRSRAVDEGLDWDEVGNFGDAGQPIGARCRWGARWQQSTHVVSMKMGDERIVEHNRPVARRELPDVIGDPIAGIVLGVGPRWKRHERRDRLDELLIRLTRIDQ